MMRIAIQNPFEKYMPYSKGNPSNSFQDQLTEHGQGGDVYRHILFVAGTILAGETYIQGKIGYYRVSMTHNSEDLSVKIL